ncbi:efflux RND transporter periplasmic adaptor subunit [Planctomycetota bacterium]
MKNKKTSGKTGLIRKLVIGLIVCIIVAGIGGAVFLTTVKGKSDNSAKQAGTFTVMRSDLTISVTEPGDIKALNSVDLKSEVEGRTTIISIVDEGTCITAEDVNKGMILVELDSSDIKQKLTQQKITYLTASASYTDANESLDIQKKQNDSDIQAGEMKVRFALMDLQKYLGKIVSGRLISLAKTPGAGKVDFASLIYDPNNDPNLGGEALQKLRELNANISLAEAELARAADKLEGTQELFDNKYVAEIELEGDKLDLQRRHIQKEQARTAKDLFVKYEFRKEAEKLLTDYEESKRELDRTLARARSKLAQALAQLESKKATYSLQTERLEKWEKQFKACIIRAPSPGEVVYASSMGGRWERRNRPIEIGAEIRERQKIISIPDSSEMKVEIKVHETWVDKIRLGQLAKIMVPAFPEKSFTGKVLKKAPMADPEEWLNPDLKVYSTDVSIEGTYEFLKTGMSAKVEVIIEQLKDVINVPIQAVINVEGKKVCFVSNGKGSEQREVETGAFNENFVEIKSGLSEGEKVLLNPPRLTEEK